MISEALDWLVNGILGLQVGQLGLAIGLIGTALYWRKARGFAGILSSMIGKVVVSAGAVGLLLVLDIIPVLDIARAMELSQQAISTGSEIVSEVIP